MVPSLGIAGVHAEPIAIGQAITAGESDIETSVAVMYENNEQTNPTEVVSACGVCRELIRDLAANARIIVSRNGQLRKVPLEDLLPVES